MTRPASFEPISVVATLLLPRSPSLSRKILSLSSWLGWCGWVDVATRWRGVHWSWLWHLEVVLVVLMGNWRYLTVNLISTRKKEKKKRKKTYFRPAIHGKLWGEREMRETKRVTNRKINHWSCDVLRVGSNNLKGILFLYQCMVWCARPNARDWSVHIPRRYINSVVFSVYFTTSY